MRRSLASAVVLIALGASGLACSSDDDSSSSDDSSTTTSPAPDGTAPTPALASTLVVPDDLPGEWAAADLVPRAVDRVIFEEASALEICDDWAASVGPLRDAVVEDAAGAYAGPDGAVLTTLVRVWETSDEAADYLEAYQEQADACIIEIVDTLTEGEGETSLERREAPELGDASVDVVIARPDGQQLANTIVQVDRVIVEYSLTASEALDLEESYATGVERVDEWLSS